MAKCTGCDKVSHDSGGEPVIEDGTYADNKYVCTACYLYLIDLGLDEGTPQQLQERAERLVRPLNP